MKKKLIIKRPQSRTEKFVAFIGTAVLVYVCLTLWDNGAPAVEIGITAFLILIGIGFASLMVRLVQRIFGTERQAVTEPSE